VIVTKTSLACQYSLSWFEVEPEQPRLESILKFKVSLAGTFHVSGIPKTWNDVSSAKTGAIIREASTKGYPRKKS
jgi:hypothetical protein